MELGAMQDGQFMKHLVGQRVALAVEGSRRFRLPKGFGMRPFEGCSVVVFCDDLGGAGDAFMDVVGRSSKVRQIAGHRVLAFDEKQENDLWHFFVVRPRPDIVLCATDSSYLEELLRRMAQPSPPNAAPSRLPEWKPLDRAAPFWAVRHVNRARQQSDVFLPVPEVSGVLFAFDPAWGQTPRLRYFSRSKQAVRILRKQWTWPNSSIVPNVQQTAPDLIEVRVKLDGKDASAEFLFRLMWALGHGGVV
jgi:hypothetical protein